MNRPHPLPRRYLAAVIAAAAFARTAAADPPLVADGTVIDIAPGTYETTADSQAGLLVVHGGRAEGTDVYINTTGDQAHAIHVSAPESLVALKNGALHTVGIGAYGLFVRETQGTAAILEGVDILTEGASAVGASFTRDGAYGQFLGGSVATTGYAATGIQAEDGGQFSVESTVVATGGERAIGMIASGNSSSLEANDAAIETFGDQSHGVYVDGRATATLADTHVTTHGADAHAISANAGSGLITIARSTLLTGGDGATAVSVHDGARVVVRDTRIETSGNQAAALEDRGASVGLQKVQIVTRGRSSYGVVAKAGGYPGRIPTIDIRASSIRTEGAFAYGGGASDGGRLTLSGSDVRTSGANAHGLWTSGGSISATDSDVDVSGNGAYGALVLQGGTLKVDGGTVSSKRGAALGLNNPGTVRIGSGARLYGGNGAFAEVDPTSTQPFTVSLDGGATAIGDIRLSDEPGAKPPDATTFSLAITNDAQWSGASSIVRQLSLENGGTWTVTGDSHVESLRSDHGIVAFAPSVVGTFATLTIAGDYEGNGGLFRMRGRLSDDLSPTDRVHVMGNATGTGLISVDSLGGAGANTREGIPLVRVDGRSDAVFRLSGRAIAGAHEYFLHKGSVSEPDDGGWYLRAYLPEPVVNPVVEPETGTPPDDPAPPVEPDAPVVSVLPPRTYVLRPEAGTYRANQTAVRDMFQAGPDAGEDQERDDTNHGAWARFERRHTTFDLRDQLTTTTATNELTLGSDLWRGGDAVESHLGIMAAAGQSDTRGTSLLTRYSARGRVRGAAGGIYGGLRTDAGTYLRGWTQYAHFSQSVEGDALQRERYDSGMVSASIEAGHRWRRTLGKASDAYLEPQAQILASRVRGGTHIEANGTRVTPQHTRGVSGRLGMRAAARWKTPKGHVASPYVAANWLRRLGRLDATQLNDETLTGGVPRNSYALKLGVTFLRQSGWRMWGDVETRFGARHYRRFAGTLGMRKAW